MHHVVGREDFCLDSGALIADGLPREVCGHVGVIKAYLGDDFCVED